MGCRAPALNTALSQTDSAPFEAQIHRYYATLYAYAYSLTQNRADAEDLTQETFVRAYLHYAQYDSSRPVLNWLMRIAYHAFIDDFRRRKSHLTVSLSALTDLENGETPVPFQTPDSTFDPQRLLLEKVFDERLECALESLSPEFRAALLLCDVMELSYLEIAEALHCSLGTVRSRVYRARQRVKNDLLHGARPSRRVRASASP